MQMSRSDRHHGAVVTIAVCTDLFVDKLMRILLLAVMIRHRRVYYSKFDWQKIDDGKGWSKAPGRT